MPGEIIDRPDPAPGASHLPEDLLELAISLDTKSFLSDPERKAVREFRRAANYIAAAMIFLSDNVFLEEKLTHDHVKPRLLGHWGTCPGLTLVYAHLNLLIKRTDATIIFVVGPGHGAPGILSPLWLEGSLERFYPDRYTVDKKGLRNLITGFSTPTGFPSHINAEVPGSIHEGGELGYALAVAYGAVMDKPDLIVTVVVGDGEAETGPTATAWHAAKYIDPAESGAVIPIVHVNGFKISERTIYGCMDDKELVSLFTGYGFQVRIVEDLDNIDNDMSASLAWAHDEIRTIQKAAREGKPIFKPRWPVLILRTPKGWTGPKKYHGEIIEGSFHSHQVPIPDAKTSDDGLTALNDWLQSYDPSTLFTESGAPNTDILSVIPERDERKMGQIKETYSGHNPTDSPDWTDLGVPAGTENSAMKSVGQYLDRMITTNEKGFRIFSPDELESNKLSAALEHTSRNFQWDQFSRARGGRVIEILSEHTCQGMMQGYTLTGRTALFPSYESFLGIVHTMMVQYSKFVKLAQHLTPWRKPNSSITYIETSTWARQEHNGFSHQNPSFIGAVLNLKPEMARVYLPPDANCALSTVAHCLKSKGYTNLMVGSKQPTPVYLSPEEAKIHTKNGGGVFKFCTNATDEDVDAVLVGIGTETTLEVVSAAALLRKLTPQLKIRVVNVTDLMILGPPGSHPHALSPEQFEKLFTKDKPVVVNYHGYVNEIAGLLFGRGGVGERWEIEGYKEEGSTTTPFMMMLVNKVSRFDIVEKVVKRILGEGEQGGKVLTDVEKRKKEVVEYVNKEGKDPDGIYDLPTFEGSDWGKKEGDPGKVKGE